LAKLRTEFFRNSHEFVDFLASRQVRF